MKRTTGRIRGTHIGGLVALPPDGICSDLLPGPERLKELFPDTTFAPPESCQPAAPASKPPSGARVYGSGSMKRRNGCCGAYPQPSSEPSAASARDAGTASSTQNASA